MTAEPDALLRLLDDYTKAWRGWHESGGDLEVLKDVVHAEAVLRARLATLTEALEHVAGACKLGHSALDRLMGDTDWPDTDAYEVRAAQAMMVALDRFAAIKEPT